MALELQFTIGINCGNNEIDFTETTGAYNDPANPTGWGAPNAVIADVDTAELVITNLTTDITYDAITITPSSTDGETVIDTEDLEVDGVSIGDITLPDGLYKYVYTVTMDNSTVYEQSVYNLSLCEAACTIKQLAVDVDLECGCCNDDCSEELYKFLEAYTLYKALLFSGACGSQTEINTNIENLQTFLDNVDCKNC
jgi:hypothetical protein